MGWHLQAACCNFFSTAKFRTSWLFSYHICIYTVRLRTLAPRHLSLSSSDIDKPDPKVVYTTWFQNQSGLAGTISKSSRSTPLPMVFCRTRAPRRGRGWSPAIIRNRHTHTGALQNTNVVRLLCSLARNYLVLILFFYNVRRIQSYMYTCAINNMI